MTKRIRPVADSHVNRIDGVTLDESGVIHTKYGSYNPVTGEGLPIEAPRELMREILAALLQDGLDSGPAEPFDFDEFLKKMHLDDDSLSNGPGDDDADLATFDRIMNRKNGEAPRAGDEIPKDYKRKPR